MPFLVFLGRGQNVLFCFRMDLTSPPPSINNEWYLSREKTGRPKHWILSPIDAFYAGNLLEDG